MQVLAQESGLFVEGLVGLTAGQEQLVAADGGADVLELVD